MGVLWRVWKNTIKQKLQFIKTRFCKEHVKESVAGQQLRKMAETLPRQAMKHLPLSIILCNDLYK